MYLILPLSLDKKFKHLYSISQIQNKVFHISFWLSPFTRMGLLNISFSPAHYIFLEITFSLEHVHTPDAELAFHTLARGSPDLTFRWYNITDEQEEILLRIVYNAFIRRR